MYCLNSGGPSSKS